MHRRTAAFASCFIIGLPGTGVAQPAVLVAPNVVPIHDTLVTSGQPNAASLAQLGAAGFQAVIYLAPAGVSDAVPDERQIVERQGLSWLHIPIDFEHPRDGDFDIFVRTMKELAPRKVLVHCQVNMRASSLVFLHRVLVDKVPPDTAYEAVARVWSPRGPWKLLIESQLRRHGVAFELY
jgi:protein tyrosine phosphatase (PTP) superfamily phosphohydrolase (DUF442 family)